MSKLPKKKFGTYANKFIGIATATKQKNDKEYPISRDRIPIRREKRVCEKMYEPVYPPVIPDMMLLIPTVVSS